MSEPTLYLWEVPLARDRTFEAMREPSGVAWVTATSKEEAERLVQNQIGNDVAMVEIEHYDLDVPRVLSLREPI